MAPVEPELWKGTRGAVINHPTEQKFLHIWFDGDLHYDPYDSLDEALSHARNAPEDRILHTKCLGFVGVKQFRTTPILFYVLDGTSGFLHDQHEWHAPSTIRAVPLDQPKTAERKGYDLELSLMRHIRDELEAEGLYFSRTYDMTRRLSDTEEDAGDLFRWNKSFLPLGEAAAFFVRMIRGFVGSAYSENHQVFLISRRHTSRVGTRYHRRGADKHGSVANFVETEMIVASTDPETPPQSFLQLRGSIPLRWKQSVNLKYTPLIKLHPDSGIQSAVYGKHMRWLSERYGRVTSVSLLDLHGPEAELAGMFKESAAEAGDPFIEYDFHTECKGMQYHKISGLIEQLSVTLKEDGVGRVGSPQRGCPKVNCKDCLDRTNVVQTMIAKHMLKMMTESTELESESFQEMFRAMWTDNGNAISTQYAGTGALKDDFTRNGLRTRKGAMSDGVKSVKRYILGNFFDGARQDRMDLAVTMGVDLRAVSAVADHGGLKVAMGFGLLCGLGGLIAYRIIGGGGEIPMVVPYVLVATAVVSFVTLIKMGGEMIVQRPRVHDDDSE
ncbi:SacI [Carpediemonas membranifera]|uniref:SacI n=1 Tax=Carpediemonas membranifera TaxID=201153 RepID=A0A8J6AY77_9EUKA|nr:SacI [Carpediemonas membranifera]|eukprot:KAG9391323.1 SacI [Carpediemonas membranifera]